MSWNVGRSLREHRPVSVFEKSHTGSGGGRLPRARKRWDAIQQSSSHTEHDCVILRKQSYLLAIEDLWRWEVVTDHDIVPEARCCRTLVRDNFQRVNRPTNFESNAILSRDVNHFVTAIRFQPGGRTLTAGLRYENRIDYFESVRSSFANRIQHTIGLRGNWQFLPYTRFYLDASYGFFKALGDNELNGQPYKSASNPLRVFAGVATSITPVTTLRAFGGYAYSTYDFGPNFSGVIGGAEVGWRYLPTGRLIVRYEREFRDSINANHYADHGFEATVNQQIEPFLLSAGAAVRLRRYDGVPMQLGAMGAVRDDLILTTNARATYVLTDKYSFYVDYNFVSVDTDFRINMDDPSYVRHLLVAGASVYY